MFDFNIDLQKLALTRKAISFWEQDDIRCEVREFWRDNKSTSIFKWDEFFRGIIQKSKTEILPNKLEYELMSTVLEVGIKISQWFSHVQEVVSAFGPNVNVEEYAENLCWTQYGTVDEIETIRKFWLNNPKLDVLVVYNMACIKGFEEGINFLRNKLPKHVDKNNNYKNKYYNIVMAYWKYYYQEIDSDKFFEVVSDYFWPIGLHFPEQQPIEYCMLLLSALTSHYNAVSTLR